MPLPGALQQEPPIDPQTKRFTRPWVLWLNSLASGTGVAAAPANAQYVVGAANAALPNERVATTSTDVTADISVANIIKWFLTLTGVTAGTYGDATHIPQLTVDAKGRLSAVSSVAISAGTVTTTGSPVSGELTKFSGATSITNGDLSGDVTTAGTLATTIANNAVTTVKINNAAVTYAKIQATAAASVLIGRESGSAGTVEEITLGTNLSMTGTTLNAASGGGTVTTTGSPANGNLTKFSGATSITNGDLSGDVTTNGTLATTIANTGTSAGTFGDSTHTSVVTVNLKGQITAISTAAITPSGIGGIDDTQALALAVAL